MPASPRPPAHSAPPSSGPGPLPARPPPRPAGWPVAGPHLCSLVLEPDLDHTHAEARLRRQRLPDLPREGGTGQAWGWAEAPGRWQVQGLGGEVERPGPCRSLERQRVCGGVRPRPTRPPLTFRQGLEETSKGGLESSSLLRCEDGRGRLGLRPGPSVVPTALALAALSHDGHVPILISLFTVGDTMQRVNPRILRNPLRAEVLSPPANTWRLPRGLQGKDRPFPRPTGHASSPSLISCPPAPPSPVCSFPQQNGPCVLISAL